MYRASNRLSSGHVSSTHEGNIDDKMTATAMGIVITSGWIGLVVSSPIIGGIAGDEATNLKTGLLVLPVFSILMIIVNLVLRHMLARPRSTV